MNLAIDTARQVPDSAELLGVGVATSGPVAKHVGLTRAALAANGFDGKVGQTLLVPGAKGPSVLAIGLGDPGLVTTATLRGAAAALTRASSARTHVATTLGHVPGLDPADAAQAVAEGLVLGAYRFTRFKSSPPAATLQRATLVASQPSAIAGATSRGAAIGEAVALARNLANTPPTHLNALDFAEVAVRVGSEMGLRVETYERARIEEMRLGGVLGVNRGSVNPPAVVKLAYEPPSPRGTVCLVGKGIMYDSGGISLKPSDEMHTQMKMDMSGAAAVLATMSVLPLLDVDVRVVGFCMCTDNMPSGSALKLGDVLTIRDGTTVEIHNTDAEGRLVLADGLALSVEEKPDAIVDIATLTGSVMGALGKKIAGVMGSSQAWVDEVAASAERTGERVWPLPLAKEYRSLLDSDVADLKNVGGRYGGAITAALFLAEFARDIPWAHLDIAGVMASDADEGWLSKGATGFGVRLLADLLTHFVAPVG